MNLLSKEHIIARSGFNRWMVPPAALAIHLSIGMAYGFSIFWLPLSHAIGITKPLPCPQDMSFWQTVFITSCDWKISWLGWMYTLFFVFLGASAAVLGPWLEHAGPRKAGVAAACCWGGGLLISAYGVYTHQIWLMWLGSGVIGGCGLGLGYISPISTLIKWFPDKRGMATGMAIMGFGGGTIIGAPLADLLMKYYQTKYSVGVWETFVTLGILYFIAMLCGAFAYRIPPITWKPTDWTPPPQKHSMITAHHVHLNQVHKTPQFWLLWSMLCLNVSAGIGVLGMASPMFQEIFNGRVTNTNIVSLAASFVGLLSLFNIAGRIIWSSTSDYIGRKATYFIFFILGMILYASVPFAEKSGNVILFVSIFCIILTMYGGAFATIPAYLADLFGTQFVGAIHGRLLTAWAVAGVLGPVLVNYIREFQIARGIPLEQVYNTTMYVLAGLLLIGFFCNLAVKPVAKKFYMQDTKLVAEHHSSHTWQVKANSWFYVAVAWTLVSVPLGWGLYKTAEQASTLFK